MIKTAHKVNTDILDTPAPTDSAICLPDRGARIAEMAYLKAERRGFEPGHELEDWLEAEKEFTP